MFVLVEAVRQLADEGALPVNVRFAFDGEEEVGGDSIVEWVEQDEGRADAALILDGGDDPRGQPVFTSACAGCSTSTSACGPARPTCTPGCSAPPRSTRRTRSWQRSRPSFRARTVACPTSFAPVRRRRPPRSSRPGRSFRRARSSSRAYGATPIAPGAADEFYLRTFADTSLDVNGIASGSPDLVKTVLPVEARANVSMRLAPGQDPETIRAAFERLVREASARRAPSSRSRCATARAPRSRRPTAPAIRLAADAFEQVVGARPLLVRIGRDAADLRGPRRSRPADARDRVRHRERVQRARAERERARGRDRARASRRCARSSAGSASLAPRAPFSSPLAEELAGDVLERFLRYVRVDTQGGVSGRDSARARRSSSTSRACSSRSFARSGSTTPS